MSNEKDRLELSTAGTRRNPAHARPVPQGTVESIIGLVSLLIETFGFPGTILFMSAWAVQQYSTPVQKARMIERYILGEGLSPWWPLFVLCFVFVLAVWAQDRNYRKKLAVVQGRLDEVAAEKSRLQELLASRELRHGDEFSLGEE